jgi:hypothetical protein
MSGITSRIVQFVCLCGTLFDSRWEREREGGESRASTYNCKEISQTSTDYTGIHRERDREMIGHRQLQRQAKRERESVTNIHTDKEKQKDGWIIG